MFMLGRDLLSELVVRFCPQDDFDIISLCQRILSSRLSLPIIHTVENVSNSTKKHLLTCSTDKALRYSSLIASLNTRQMQRPWATLHLLYSLREFGTEDNAYPTVNRPFSLRKEEKLSKLGPRKEEPAMPMYVDPKHHYSNQTLILEIASVNEEELVTDVLFAVQGIPAKHIEFTENGVFVDVTLPEPTRQLIMKIVELGELYTFLQAIRFEGLVGNTLCTGIETVLIDLCQSVAFFRGSSLVSVYRWALPHLQSFRSLKRLAEKCNGITGCKLADMLLTHVYPESMHSMQSLKESVLGVLARLVLDWTQHGKLNNEFWVEQSGRDWQDGYNIILELVPPSFDADMVEKVKRIGQCVSFMKANFEWNAEKEKISVFTYAYNNNSLKEWIEGEYRSVNQVLMSNLLKKSDLAYHLRAFRDYMLLGRGDFIFGMMESIGKDLDRNASSLYRHVLVTALDTSCMDSKAAERLDVVVFPSAAEDVGYDVFTLDYHADKLRIIFNAASMKDYQLLFNHLFNLYKYNYKLNEKYSELVQELKETFDERECKFRYNLVQIHRSSLLVLNRLLVFIRSLYNYVQSVIHTEFTKLYTSPLSNIYEFIDCHASFLESVSKQMFLNDSILRNNLSNLKKVMDKFMDCQLDAHLLKETDAAFNGQLALLKEGLSAEHPLAVLL